ncbi:MAG TPA: hypothetical protein VKV40_06730 [Ktedonobacteraceae bacterium]|nr:hypothetical protein [Ktedonobacteraceae bacterium]
MSELDNTINLGEHRAGFDRMTGKFSLFEGSKELVTLTADEAYRLLTWLQEHYGDRLYQEALESGSPQHAAAKQISEEEIRLVQQAQVSSTPEFDNLLRQEFERQEGSSGSEAQGGK